jgi:hypothetical protein
MGNLLAKYDSPEVMGSLENSSEKSVNRPARSRVLRSVNRSGLVITHRIPGTHASTKEET